MKATQGREGFLRLGNCAAGFPDGGPSLRYTVAWHIFPFFNSSLSLIPYGPCPRLTLAYNLEMSGMIHFRLKSASHTPQPNTVAPW